MHQYLGHFSYVIISVDRLIRMKRSEATRKKKKTTVKRRVLYWLGVQLSIDRVQQPGKLEHFSSSLRGNITPAFSPSITHAKGNK